MLMAIPWKLTVDPYTGLMVK